MLTSKERSLSKNIDSVRLILKWDEYLNDINQLVYKIKESNIKFDIVYGIPRGGLILATILSHQLNIELIDYSLLNTLYVQNKILLLIDDLVDSGNTLTKYSNLYQVKMCNDVKTATLYKHKKSLVIPNFYIKENESWIVFPYESD